MKHFIIRMNQPYPIFWLSRWCFVQYRFVSVSLGSQRPLFVLITCFYHLLNYFLFIFFKKNKLWVWPGLEFSLCVNHTGPQLTEICMPRPLGCLHQRHESACPTVCFLCSEEDWQHSSVIHCSLSFKVHTLVNYSLKERETQNYSQLIVTFSGERTSSQVDLHHGRHG